MTITTTLLASGVARTITYVHAVNNLGDGRAEIVFAPHVNGKIQSKKRERKIVDLANIMLMSLNTVLKNSVVVLRNDTYVVSSTAKEESSFDENGFIVLGAVLVDTYESWGKISASMPLAKSGSVVYARMMHKVIDRITGIGMDRMRSDQVKFVLAKYFLIGMMGRPANETTDSIATAATAGSANNALVDFESALGQAAGATNQAELYGKGSLDFIDALAKAAPWMTRLTARGFVQNFSSMYGPPSLLMAEDAGYFYALMATHQAGAEIISGFSFDPVYGREGDEALDEMARLVR